MHDKGDLGDDGSVKGGLYSSSMTQEEWRKTLAAVTDDIEDGNSVEGILVRVCFALYF